MDMNPSDRPATKSDVGEIVGRVVGEIVGDAVRLVSEKFTVQDSKIDRLEATTNRIENKLDATADKVDDYEARIKKLEPITA